MRFAAVADTHTALWYLFADHRLSQAAYDFIQEAARANAKIAVSSISLAEMVYLTEKGRIPASACRDLEAALAQPDHVLAEVAFTGAVVRAMSDVPRSEVPDMPDRMIAATARNLNVPVISRDRRIRAATLMTLW